MVITLGPSPSIILGISQFSKNGLDWTQVRARLLAGCKVQSAKRCGKSTNKRGEIIKLPYFFACRFRVVLQLTEPLEDASLTKRTNCLLERLSPGVGGKLPYKRLLGMCRWMGSHFHDWTDYNGVAFLIELLEWDRTFS